MEDQCFNKERKHSLIKFPFSYTQAFKRLDEGHIYHVENFTLLCAIQISFSSRITQ